MAGTFEPPRLMACRPTGYGSAQWQNNSDTITIDLCNEIGGPSNEDVAEILLTVDQIRLDFRPRFCARLRYDRSSSFHEQNRVQVLTYELANVGWSRASPVEFVLCGDGSELLLPEFLRMDCTLDPGEICVFTVDHGQFDRLGLDRLRHKRLKRQEEMPSQRFEYAYQQHLANLRGPAMRINEIRMKNYLKMTALGRAWEFIQMPVLPHDTPEQRERFREIWSSTLWSKSSPRFAPSFNWRVRDCNGVKGDGSITPKGEYLGQITTIHVDQEHFKVEQLQGHVIPEQPPSHLLEIDTNFGSHEVPVSSIRRQNTAFSWFGLPTSGPVWHKAHIELGADRSCWVRLGARTVLHDGTCLESLPVSAHIVAKPEAIADLIP